jgi:hypothetical protein
VDLEHLQYLSPRAILLLAGKLGLGVEHIETTGFPGLAGIDRKPMVPSCFRTGLQEVRNLVSSSPVGPIARAILEIGKYRRGTQDRTMGTYHLFAVLSKR